MVRQIFTWVGFPATAVRCEKSPGGCSNRVCGPDRVAAAGTPGRSAPWCATLPTKGMRFLAKDGPARRDRVYVPAGANRRSPRPPARSTSNPPEHIGIAVTALVDAELFATRRSGWRRIGGVCGTAPPPATFCKACWSAAPVATDCLYKHLGYNKSIPITLVPESMVSSAGTTAASAPMGGKRTEAVGGSRLADVSALLSEPQRLRQEFQRRQQISQAPGPEVNHECLQGDVHKVRQSIGRLIDAYTAG